MKNRINNILLILILLIGIYFPTSIYGTISVSLKLKHYFILMFFLGIMLLINKKNKIGLVYSSSINIFILLFTLLNSMINNNSNYFFGAYIPYILISMIYFIDLRNIKVLPILKITFITTNIVNITLAILIILDSLTIQNFFIKYYTSGFETLLIFMFARNKPVLFFASHSIASFFFYLYFFINFKYYISTKNKFYFLLLLSNLTLILFLKSVSSYIFFTVGAIQLFYYLVKTSKKTLFITGPILLFIIYKIILSVKDNLIIAFTSQRNGFLGRFSSSGVLNDTLHYIVSNIPIGLCSVSDLYYTDSGIVSNLLKGSVFLVLAVYMGLFSFLNFNITNKKNSYTFFAVIIAFEVGFPGLFYNRMLYFLPFATVYLNNIE